MPELANEASPGEIRMINGEAKIALVGFNKQGDTCLKWYVPKCRRDICAARRFINGMGRAVPRERLP
jgi:hypothetical protein